MLSTDHSGRRCLCRPSFALSVIFKSLRRALPAAAAGAALFTVQAEAAEITISSFADYMNSGAAAGDSVKVATPFANTALTEGGTIDGHGLTFDFTGVETGNYGYEWFRRMLTFAPTDPSAALTVKNFGSWSGNWKDYVQWEDEGTYSGIKIDEDSITGGVVNVTNTGFISGLTGSKTESLTVENSVFRDITDQDAVPFMEIWGDVFTFKNNAVVNLSKDYYSTTSATTPTLLLEARVNLIVDSLFSSANLALYSPYAYPDIIYVSGTAFVNSMTGGVMMGNSSGSMAGLYGAAMSLWGQKDTMDLIIRDSYFLGGSSYGATGGTYVNGGGARFFISDSVYADNHGNYHGGAIYINNPAAGAEITIRDTQFYRNLQEAIYVKGQDATAQLNIIAEKVPVIFKENTVGTDLCLANVTANINAAENLAVELHDGANRLKEADGYVEFNLNKPDLTYTELGYDLSANAETAEVKKTPSGGEIRIYGPMTNLDIRTFGGTLRLLPPDVEYVISNDTAAKAAFTDFALEADSDSHFTNIFLKDSHLTVVNDTFLKTQTVEPITSEAYDLHEEAAIIKVSESTLLQTVMLGDRLTLNANLRVQPAVNLETAQSDKFTVGDGNAEVTGTGRILVSGWIVKADNTDEGEVTVKLTPDNEKALTSYFGIEDSAAKAYGPVYIWNVKHTGGSTYVFYKNRMEEAVEKAESEDPAPLIVDGEPIPQIDPTPYNFNPDIYGEQVAALGVAVIEHSISDSVFSEMRTGRLATLIPNEKPDRQPWWGKVIGADLDLKSKNFYPVDMKYAIGMIGHQFEPLRSDYGDTEFGVYIGAATATEKYSISKVRQNGGFAGASVLYRKDGLWAGAHANVGIMSNKLKGVSNASTDNPWVGAGATLGYTFAFPAVQAAVAPLLDMSYVYVKSKDYTTGLGAKVSNSYLHSFEIAPGVRADKQFVGGWSVKAQARYAFVTRHDGNTRASYEDGESVHLPAITNKNYAEYGIGVRKQAKNFSFALTVNRSDGGRRGWTGIARASWRF